jgi:predicted transcriptional regulator
MDPHAYHKLQILNHIEGGPYVTNRRVAAKLGVSVKLAHSLFRGLIRRGLVHATRRDGRSMYYLLTPAGVNEKLRLTYEFIEFSTQFFREARRRSSGVCRRLAVEGVRRVGFIGCGDLAEIAFLGIKEHGLTLTAVYDPARAGDVFLGMTVRPVSELLPGKTKGPAERCERLLVTAYDPAHPAAAHYLPEGVAADDRFVWVFGYAEVSPRGASGGASPATP